MTQTSQPAIRVPVDVRRQLMDHHHLMNHPHLPRTSPRTSPRTRIRTRTSGVTGSAWPEPRPHRPLPSRSKWITRIKLNARSAGIGPTSRRRKRTIRPKRLDVYFKSFPIRLKRSKYNSVKLNSDLLLYLQYSSI